MLEQYNKKNIKKAKDRVRSRKLLSLNQIVYKIVTSTVNYQSLSLIIDLLKEKLKSEKS